MDTHHQHESQRRLATGIRIATIVIVLGTLAAAWRPVHTDITPAITDVAHAMATAPDMSVYFPAHFPAPQGPIEPLPPQF